MWGRGLVGLVLALSAVTTAGCSSTGALRADGGGGGGAGAGGAAGVNCLGPVGIDFHDGTTGGLVLGPDNHVFQAPANDPQPVASYTGQNVFGGPTLSMVANFPTAAGSSVLASPSSGAALAPWLGELSLIPAGCHPGSLAGRVVRVRVLWSLTEAIGTVPPHALYLGTYSNGVPTAYADASDVFSDEATDAGAGTRTLNTIAAVDLVHSFSKPQDDSEGAYLRAYLLDRNGGETTTVHVDMVNWTGP